MEPTAHRQNLTSARSFHVLSFIHWLAQTINSVSYTHLRTTNLKVYEIAERVGYSDTASFYRVFKEELGVSPARYKRNLPN